MTEVATEKKPRAKKGEGPVVLAYTDGTEKSNRVNDKMTAVAVEDKAGGAAKLDLSGLGENVIKFLALENLKKRVDSHIRAGFDPTKNNALDLANEAYARLVEGKFYAKTGAAKKEGGTGKKGRPFDFQLWVDIMAEASKQKAKAGKGKEATPEMLEKFKTKMEAMQPKERADFTSGLLKDETIAWSKKAVEARRIKDKAASSSEGKTEIDLASVLG